MLVYEFVENGNLKQCLQQCTSESSPLTWNDRMKIIIGIAKGFDNLHLFLLLRIQTSLVCVVTT